MTKMTNEEAVMLVEALDDRGEFERLGSVRELYAIRRVMMLAALTVRPVYERRWRTPVPSIAHAAEEIEMGQRGY